MWDEDRCGWVCGNLCVRVGVDDSTVVIYGSMCVYNACVQGRVGSVRGCSVNEFVVFGLGWWSRVLHQFVWSGILPEWSKGADLRSARRSSAWVQTPQVPCYAPQWLRHGCLLLDECTDDCSSERRFIPISPFLPFSYLPCTPHTRCFVLAALLRVHCMQSYYAISSFYAFQRLDGPSHLLPHAVGTADAIWFSFYCLYIIISLIFHRCYPSSVITTSINQKDLSHWR